MGILDTVLRPHLEAITKYYNATDEFKWIAATCKHSEIPKILEILGPGLKRQGLNEESEIFRQQGNQLFKALEFNQALHLYTKSIAAAREGPLASLAYFNRFDPTEPIIDLLNALTKNTIRAGLQHCFT
jgi:hypothetical protein